MAWGYDHWAWFVTSDGDVFTYSSQHEPDVVGDDAQDGFLMTPEQMRRSCGRRPIFRRLSRELRSGTRYRLLAASGEGSVTRLRDLSCSDGGGESIHGFVFDPTRQVFVLVGLQTLQCDFILSENNSVAARTIAVGAQNERRLRGQMR
jgi:hypothetical protein